MYPAHSCGILRHQRSRAPDRASIREEGGAQRFAAPGEPKAGSGARARFRDHPRLESASYISPRRFQLLFVLAFFDRLEIFYKAFEIQLLADIRVAVDTASNVIFIVFSMVHVDPVSAVQRVTLKL